VTAANVIAALETRIGKQINVTVVARKRADEVRMSVVGIRHVENVARFAHGV
jgi:hypothetical protein